MYIPVFLRSLLVLWSLTGGWERVTHVELYNHTFHIWNRYKGTGPQRKPKQTSSGTVSLSVHETLVASNKDYIILNNIYNMRGNLEIASSIANTR